MGELILSLPSQGAQNPYETATIRVLITFDCRTGYLYINMLMLSFTFLKQAGSSCHISINCICEELTLQKIWIIYKKSRIGIFCRLMYQLVMCSWESPMQIMKLAGAVPTKFIHIFRVLIRPRIAYYTRRLVHYNHPLQLVHCNAWQIILRYSIWKYLVVSFLKIHNKWFFWGASMVKCTQKKLWCTKSIFVLGSNA